MLSFVYPKLSKLKLHQDSPSAARVINQAIVVEQQLTCEYRKMFILILLAALLIPLTWHYTTWSGTRWDNVQIGDRCEAITNTMYFHNESRIGCDIRTHDNTPDSMQQYIV